MQPRDGVPKSNGKQNGTHHPAASGPASPKGAVEAATVKPEAPMVAAATTEELAPLSKQRKLATLKPREGWQLHAAPMLDVYDANGVELGTSVPVVEVRAAIAEDAALGVEVEEALAKFQALADRRFERQGFVWEHLLSIYGKARTSKALRDTKAVRDFAALLKNGPRPSKDPASK